MPISKCTSSRMISQSSPRLGVSGTVRLGLASLLLVACGNTNEVSSVSPNGSVGGGVSQATGGSITTGGVNTSLGPIGGSGNGTGGAASTGGSSSGLANPSTGGSSATVSTGGTPTTGGSTSVRNTGGSVATGGAPVTGGTRSTSATGGGSSVATGGKTGTGGMASTGGTAATGGKATGGAATGGASTGISATGGSNSTCTPSTTKFSFFVTSQARLFALAQTFNGSTKGFGGDLRYGVTSAGAGLAGADKICTEIAEKAVPGNCKTWRAFLSAADGGSGAQVNAISRIGSGPWYDRIGRLFGNSITSITATRPDAAAAILNDFPNEDGVLNHDALQSGNTANQDNHDMLTGSTATGTLYGANAHCTNWTSSAADTSKKPRVGHSWPAMSGQSWMSVLDESGCAPGANLVDRGGPGSDGTVGSGGGYGGFYCFALTP
jgi:hypothetical protein